MRAAKFVVSEYTQRIPQRAVAGDITSLSDVMRAIQGVDCVIHACGYVSIQTFPDAKGMQRVNVGGINLFKFNMRFEENGLL